MKILNKTIGIIATMAVLPAAVAVTYRTTGTTYSSRMPTMTGVINSTTSASTSTSSSTTTSVDEVNRLCVDNYVGCLKGADVCGTSFQECTNNTLLFAKQGMCASTLSACSSAAIQTLYGIGSTTSFANKDSNGEYVYPADTSVLGQMVEAAFLNNRYDTSTCVRRYETCLTRGDVCGSDFELCTTDTEFKKQKLFCESTLGRCQEDGVLELFGTTTPSASPSSTSRLGIKITEGAALAAINAVSTCYKVADQCILNTCATNPYKCKAGSDMAIADAADVINNEDATSNNEISFESVTSSQVRGFIENNCFDTIGANKYCYATFLGGGAMPSNSQLQDQDNRYDVFAEAYASRMNNSMESKIDDLIISFDKKTKERCASTITNCAMGACGDGVGSACYSAAFAEGNTVKGVTSDTTLSDIKFSCESIVNNDDYCKYAGATFDNATGTLSFLGDGLFDFLFTSMDDDVTTPDPIGVVGELNAKLSSSYNAAALNRMEDQCEIFATQCVISECGDGFENCYRNRNDIYSTLTATTSDSFNKSMNKVGGVLDYTVIIGLCLNQVKNNSVCNEHLRAEAARSEVGKNTSNVWGSDTTIRNSWLGAGAYDVSEDLREAIQQQDENGQDLCKTQSGVICVCGTTSGGQACDTPYTISEYDYTINAAGTNLFSQIIFDLEKEAQAEYNAKLTKQQNMCLSGNTGITGFKVGGTFMWAKLKNNKIPSDYPVNGLEDKDFVSSNEIHNSFCRIRVTLQSEDKAIQDLLKKDDKSTAYFAAGDSFTCGSWLTQGDLDDITKVISEDVMDDREAGDKRTKTWATIGGVAAGLLGGGFGGNAIETKFGGLWGDPKAVYDSREESSAALTTAKRQLSNLEEELADLEERNTDNSLANDIADLEEEIAEKEDDIDRLEEDLRTAEDTKTKQWAGTTIGAGVGGAVGGVLGWGIAKSATTAATEAAVDEAVMEWLDSMSSTVKCYIGPDEVGSYGDVISTEME